MKSTNSFFNINKKSSSNGPSQQSNLNRSTNSIMVYNNVSPNKAAPAVVYIGAATGPTKTSGPAQHAYNSSTTQVARQ